MCTAEPDFTGATWYKSSRSQQNSQCVEVAFTPGWVGVRDSKQHGTGPTLTFTRAEWAAFLAGAQDGEFELPESH